MAILDLKSSILIGQSFCGVRFRTVITRIGLYIMLVTSDEYMFPPRRPSSVGNFISTKQNVFSLSMEYDSRDFFFLTLSQTMPGFYVYAAQVFRKHCWKRRNCSLRAISPFPTVFPIGLENFMPFSSNLKLSSANSLRLEECKICRLGKG